jgi:hypothetical protein
MALAGTSGSIIVLYGPVVNGIAAYLQFLKLQFSRLFAKRLVSAVKSPHLL